MDVDSTAYHNAVTSSDVGVVMKAESSQGHNGSTAVECFMGTGTPQAANGIAGVQMEDDEEVVGIAMEVDHQAVIAGTIIHATAFKQAASNSWKCAR